MGEKLTPKLKLLERDKRLLKKWIKEDKGTPLERIEKTELYYIQKQINERRKSGKRRL